jgi:hypothetical protein
MKLNPEIFIRRDFYFYFFNMVNHHLTLKRGVTAQGKRKNMAQVQPVYGPETNNIQLAQLK